MNKEEILNKYIDLIDKGYCCDCNELNCIGNFPHSKITHAIRELQQENKKLNGAIQTYDILLKANTEENKRLKDNWNKLKEWASNFYNSEEVGWAGCGMRYTLEKMQELEGSDK